MIKYFDDVRGNLTNALKQCGLWNNLLFVLSGDNEVDLGMVNNYPLKGGKYSDWQGGIRVNAFVSGGCLPEKMRSQNIDGYIHLTDW